jgi:two-component sensor histidine kinase
LVTTAAPCEIRFEAPAEIQFAADRAILVGLIVNELVSNAGKYAYPDRSGGLIWVSLHKVDDRAILVSVRDEGVGLPPGFDPMTSKRLGTRLVNALSSQLSADLTRPASPVGTNFTLLIPLSLTTIE